MGLATYPAAVIIGRGEDREERASPHGRGSQPRIADDTQ